MASLIRAIHRHCCDPEMPRKQQPRAAKAAGESERRSLGQTEDQPSEETSKAPVASRTRSGSPIKISLKQMTSKRPKEASKGKGRKSKKSESNEEEDGEQVVVEDLDAVEEEEEEEEAPPKKRGEERRGREKTRKRKRAQATEESVEEAPSDKKYGDEGGDVVEQPAERPVPDEEEEDEEDEEEDDAASRDNRRRGGRGNQPKRDFSYLEDLKILHRAYQMFVAGQNVTRRYFTQPDTEPRFRLRNHSLESCWNRYRVRLWRFLEAHADYFEKAPILEFPSCDGDMRDPMARLPIGVKDPELPKSHIPSLPLRMSFIDLKVDVKLPDLPEGEELYEKGEQLEPIKVPRYPLSPQGKVRTRGPDGKFPPLELDFKRRKVQEEEEDQISINAHPLVLDDVNDDDNSQVRPDIQLPEHQERHVERQEAPIAETRVPPMFWIEDNDLRNQLMKDQIQSLAAEHHVSTRRVLRAYLLCNGRPSKMSKYLKNPLSVKIFSTEEDVALIQDKDGVLTSQDLPRFTDTEIVERRAFLFSKSYTAQQ